jgi:hypothetical protein
MKKVILLVLCAGIYLTGIHQLEAQTKPQKETKEKEAEEESPLIFKFDPDYSEEAVLERNEFLAKRAIIDTMDISEARRTKLIRDLYMHRDSRRLAKVLVADTNSDAQID